MPKPICPQCNHEIVPDDINVGKDLAYCRRCNVSNFLSDLTDQSAPKPVNLNVPPPGSWYRREGQTQEVGASYRAIMQGLGLFGCAVFWNGIMSVFVGIAIAATLSNLHLSCPQWLPTPKMNGDSMGWGMTLGLWAFLTPFIAVGIGMIIGAIMSFAGQTKVRIENKQGKVFTGVGVIGWTRRFDPMNVEKIDEDLTRWQSNGQSRVYIVMKMKGGKKLKLGSGLNEERREFMIGALRQMLH